MESSCRLSQLTVCLSVCVSVCLESVLWQNDWLDPDTIWDGDCDRGMGVLDGGGYHRREMSGFGVDLGRPTVTNGDFVA